MNEINNVRQSEATSLTNDQNDERNRRGALILAAFVALLGASVGIQGILGFTHHDPTALFLGVEAATVLGMAAAYLFYKNCSKEEQTAIHRTQLQESYHNDLEMQSLNRARLRHEEQTVLDTHHPQPQNPLCQ